MTSTSRRLIVLALLMLTLAATRLHHFATLPDASWAVFFVAGFHLRAWSRWAFPLLMALAVLVDAWVINAMGLEFWQHYCVSLGYWMLLPAYFTLWTGGVLLRQGQAGARWTLLPRAAVLLLASVAVCHLFAQGGFYWTSSNVAGPTLAGWWKNYTDWLGPYLATTALYVALAAAVQLALAQAGKLAQARRQAHT